MLAETPAARSPRPQRRTWYLVVQTLQTLPRDILVPLHQTWMLHRHPHILRRERFLGQTNRRPTSRSRAAKTPSVVSTLSACWPPSFVGRWLGEKSPSTGPRVQNFTCVRLPSIVLRDGESLSPPPSPPPPPSLPPPPRPLRGSPSSHSLLLFPFSKVSCGRCGILAAIAPSVDPPRDPIPGRSRYRRAQSPR